MGEGLEVGLMGEGLANEEGLEVELRWEGLMRRRD